MTPAEGKRSWWKKRTSMERGFLISSILLFLVAVGFIIAFSIVFVNHKQETTTQSVVCITEQCFQSTLYLLKNMDTSVDPCENFYEYACGNFLKQAIPADKTGITAIGKIQDDLNVNIRKVLEKPTDPNEATPFVMAKNLYNTCMDTNTINEHALATITEILNELGGWPVVVGPEWDGSNFDWKKTVYKMSQMGFGANYLLDFSVGADLKNSSKNRIIIDEGNLFFPREVFMEGSTNAQLNKYYNYMILQAVAFGADKTFAITDLRESLQFESDLARISLPTKDRKNFNLLNNLLSISKLHEDYPVLPWVEYINTLLQPGEATVDDTEIVIVTHPKYFTDLQELLNAKPKRVIANYLIWRLIAFSAPYLSAAAAAREEEYRRMATGRKAAIPRWLFCVSATTNALLPMAISALYIRNNFNKESREIIEHIVTNLRKEFLEELEKVEWMDNATKERAITKATMMKQYLGFPDQLLDDNKVKEYYSPLTFSSPIFLKMILDIQMFYRKLSLSALRKPVDKSNWVIYSTVAVVNAFYAPTQNSIQLPAGILQGVFFNKDKPSYMNYAAVGMVIGHEITHGFDDLGAQFNEHGDLANWWEANTQNIFKNKSECIVQQYGNYIVPEINKNLDGQLTLGENIADNGGLNTAYLAYKKLAMGNEPLPLPGLHNTHTIEQMFWISAANTWCAKYRPEYLTLQVMQDEHSPERFRVIGPFSNNIHFAKDFNCSIGSKMNPVNKCKVW